MIFLENLECSFLFGTICSDFKDEKQTDHLNANILKGI